MAQQEDVIASREAHERFEANMQAAIEQAQTAQPAPTVNEQLLQTANDMQAQVDENGRRLYLTDSLHRDRVEAIRMEAFGGPAVPVEQQQEQQPVEPPQGTPQERAEADLNERLDSGDVIEPGTVNDATWDQLSAGYNLSTVLPPGFGIDAYGAEQLYAARQAGLTEQQVQSIIAQLVKAQQ